MTTKPRTLYEKIWDAHVVERRDDGTCLVYIDRHLVHEVTSPQAFEGLRVAGRPVRRPDLTLAVPDHNLPTTPRKDAQGNRIPITDAESANQLKTLAKNAPEFGIRYISEVDAEQGIVHRRRRTDRARCRRRHGGDRLGEPQVRDARVRLGLAPRPSRAP